MWQRPSKIPPGSITMHGRMHFAGNHTLRFDLDAALGKYHAIKSTGDDHAIAFDLSFDAGAFTKNDGLLGDDVALDVSIDAEGSLQLKRALEGHTLVNETCPLLAAAIL